LDELYPTMYKKAKKKFCFNFALFAPYVFKHTNFRRLVNAVGKLSIETLFKSTPRAGLNNKLRSGAFSLLSANNDSSNC
ncbi:unnamed protein product, partial [Adineta steineri]